MKQTVFLHIWVFFAESAKRHRSDTAKCVVSSVVLGVPPLDVVLDL